MNVLGALPIPGTEAARQRTSDGRWHFTVSTVGGHVPAGACAHGCPGHDSAEEAYSHEFAHRLATAKFLVAIDPTRCRVSGCIFTTKRAALAGEQLFPLCAAHHDRKSLAGLVRVTP